MAESLTLLFIHAYPLDGLMWADQVDALRESVDSVIAPSLPGFGGRDVPAEQPSLDLYADSLARELDDRDIRRAVVCGLSMGGYIAFALWRRHRERVAGLVLADTKAEADTVEARARRGAVAQLVRERGAGALADAPPPLLREASPRWELVRRIIRAQPAEALAQASLALGERPDSTPDLATIDVPTAVVVGAEDAVTPPANAETVARGVRGSTLTVLRDAGHLSNLEQPEAFNDAVRELVGRVRAAR